MQWYESLEKPAWTPDPETISIIWQILYPIIFFSFGYVFFKAIQGKISWSVSSLRLTLSRIYHSAFYSGAEPNLASVDIIVVLATTIRNDFDLAASRWVAIAQVPYLIWVTIATCLQLAITQMNDFAA